MGFKVDNLLYHVAQTFYAEDATNGWLFQFGAVGTTRIIVLAEPGTSNLDDALEAAAEVVADVAPGVFATDAVLDAYHENLLAGASEEDAQEEAETDMTSVLSGNEYIPSWEWYVADIYPGDPVFDGAVAYAVENQDDY